MATCRNSELSTLKLAQTGTPAKIVRFTTKTVETRVINGSHTCGGPLMIFLKTKGRSSANSYKKIVVRLIKKNRVKTEI